MKGMVFTEFLEMVEDAFSFDVADEMIDRANVPSGAAYTSVGTYDHNEIVQLVTELSAITGTPASELVKTFGRHMFTRFAAGFPQFFNGVDTAIEFLLNVDKYIHVEVLKLYPDAELPKFDIREPRPGQLEMIYRSHRPFADLAEGLIEGCAAHYDDEIRVERTEIEDTQGGGTRFLLKEMARVPA